MRRHQEGDSYNEYCNGDEMYLELESQFNKQEWALQRADEDYDNME